MFPSLSERAFFRTGGEDSRCDCESERVSISFRESLLSDQLGSSELPLLVNQQVSISFRESLLSDMKGIVQMAIGGVVGFHLFQREPSFGLFGKNLIFDVLPTGFHLFQREPSFGLYYDFTFKTLNYEKGFHLFQREPSFGRGIGFGLTMLAVWMFPSLSERAFFRTLSKMGG